jgi:hypothetical protein
VSLDARSISLRDLLLALRVDGGQMEADGSITAALRGEFAADGTPQIATGRLLMVKGEITDPNSPESRIPIDRAEMTLDWSSAQHALAMPFQLVSGGARFTLIAHAEAPRDPAGTWALGLTGGSVVLSPATPDEEAVMLNRIIVRGRLDPVAQRLNIEQAEASGKGIGLAMSGNLDFSSSDPRLAIGLATRNISGAAFKQLWPPFINPPVRTWVMERVSGGVVEQGEIATNAPISTLRNGGPPVPDDGLSIQIVTSGTTVRPFDNLPEIRDADLVTRIKGRSATVTLGRGNIEMPSGRRLTMANGVFEVPETLGEHPPARVRARIEGPVAAGVDLLSMDRLKDTVGVQFDAATTRGNILATLNMSMPLGVEIKNNTMTYAISADIVNFSADRFLMSQKVESQMLRAVANNQGYQIRGDMRIGGVPATAEMRRNSGDAAAEIKLQATLDDAARNRLGWETAGSLIGPVGVKVSGRIDLGGEQDNRLAVEADFTPAKIENLLPGWMKMPNRPARDLHLRRKGKAGRFEDLTFDGGGASVRGSAETDANGDLLAASFPVFGMSDGDKASLRVERTPDNLYKAVIRGDVYDGRGFVKSSMSGSSTDPKLRRPGIDFELDAKFGALVGLKGEALRNVDLRLLRRGGTLRSLALNAKIGGDGNLVGELRGRPGERQSVYIESTDAGALFRFTDTYSRMYGGQMWVAMDPPNANGTPQDGLLNVSDFTVRGEAALDRVVAGAPNGPNNGVQFSRMRVGFTRAPGKMSIREGLVSGPMVGATIDGVMDYANNDLRMRGTFVPLYGLNSAFGEIPIVGFLLGGKEGLIGSMTYEVVGTPGQPILRVNPISMVAPGSARKFFEFPSSAQ